VFTAEDCICRHQITRARIGFYWLRFSLHGAEVVKLSRSWGVHDYAKLVPRTKKLIELPFPPAGRVHRMLCRLVLRSRTTDNGLS